MVNIEEHNTLIGCPKEEHKRRRMAGVETIIERWKRGEVELVGYRIEKGDITLQFKEMKQCLSSK